MLKALFVFKVFDFFDFEGKGLDKKAKNNLKIYGVSAWTRNHYNTNTVQYLTKKSIAENEIWSVKRI